MCLTDVTGGYLVSTFVGHFIGNTFLIVPLCGSRRTVFPIKCPLCGSGGLEGLMNWRLCVCFSGQDVLAWIASHKKLDTQGNSGSGQNIPWWWDSGLMVVTLCLSVFVRGSGCGHHAGGVWLHLPSAGPQKTHPEARRESLPLPGTNTVCPPPSS